MTFPSANHARQALRLERVREAKVRAAKQAQRAWSSMKCDWGQHAPGGCANDGTTCLCTCHDTEEKE